MKELVPEMTVHGVCVNVYGGDLTFEIQLQLGRDVAGLIEAAANNWYLRQQGYSAAEEFMSRIEADITGSEKL